MASSHLGQNGDCFNNPHVEKLLSPEHNGFREAKVSPQIPSDSHDAVDKFGEPEILPRIGDVYQVELPPLTESRSRKLTDAETRAVPYQNFLIGLPILLTWISSLRCNVLGSRSRSKSTLGKRSRPGYLLVPGLVCEYWNPTEKDSFLLGLYIFEKNFVEVRRFVGTKEMGALLSFYYGEFYGSQEYRRWSDCRKMKGKKGIYGQRIFSGVRQQELLSRILPRVSQECRNAILEVSKTFADEKMSLADYVSSLKAMVGMNGLIEAVGIGRGKLDLTRMAVEPSRSNQVNIMRPEIPTGKACSSLTTAEIVKFLNGDYRLSKARSNDLFWEAVWPRLLARGWHSEQPKNQGYICNSRHCLVFLMPGIKKFSRRKLSKGEQYFDSVTDVLSKVAREPGLIELDSEEDGGSKKKEEYESPGERKLERDDNDVDKKQQHCYLQPRTPKRNTVVLKFTVVDTSLSDGKVRELRSLPSETSNAFTAQERNEDSYEDTSEENSDESNCIDTAMLDASVTDDVFPKTAKSDEKILIGHHDSYKDTRTVSPDISGPLVPDFKKKKKDSRGNNQSKKVSKSQSSRKMKQDNVDHVGPTTKRSRILTACSKEETNAGLLTSSRLENGMLSSCRSGVNEVTENLSSQVGPSWDKLSTVSLPRSSPGEKGRPLLLSAGGVMGPSEPANSSAAPQIEEAENGASNSGNSNMLVESQVPPPEANKDTVSGR
ncbi:hypothetical protein DH2020_027326 [Rehmannia glutinosa]|uniref:SANT domain-containing protein n=1 Tax=Rehmannia glutinosa TaxID=99300 RepID=A0ABR0VUI1_REHGL